MAISRSSLISLNKEVEIRARWISNVFMSLPANVGSRSTCEAMLRYLTREKLTLRPFSYKKKGDSLLKTVFTKKWPRGSC